MKVSIMGLLRQAAQACVENGDPALAYSVLELGNNLRLVMRGEETFADFQSVYVGADGEPFDIDKMLPVPVDA
jgi:hypothetical protein